MIDKIYSKIVLKYGRLGLKLNHWHGILIILITNYSWWYLKALIKKNILIYFEQDLR